MVPRPWLLRLRIRSITELFITHDGSVCMPWSWFAIYHQYTPVMLAYTPYMDPMGYWMILNVTSFSVLLSNSAVNYYISVAYYYFWWWIFTCCWPENPSNLGLTSLNHLAWWNVILQNISKCHLVYTLLYIHVYTRILLELYIAKTKSVRYIIGMYWSILAIYLFTHCIPWYSHGGKLPLFTRAATEATSTQRTPPRRPGAWESIGEGKWKFPES